MCQDIQILIPHLNKYKYFPIKFIHYKPASGKNAFYKFKGLNSSFQENVKWIWFKKSVDTRLAPLTDIAH